MLRCEGIHTDNKTFTCGASEEFSNVNRYMVSSLYSVDYTLCNHHKELLEYEHKEWNFEIIQAGKVHRIYDDFPFPKF